MALEFRVATNSKFIPHYYQNDATEAVLRYFAQGNKGGAVIAMPTGTGKSLVAAMIMAYCIGMWPNLRFLCLTHVKELIANNVADLVDFWPSAPVGIYSAGLKEKTAHTQIVCGGVQSVVHNVTLLGHRDVVIIDEAHLYSSKDGAMYTRIIEALTKINPYLKVIGLSATPYRTAQGLITNGTLFTDIVYDITTMEWFNRLINEGYLSPLIVKPTSENAKVEPVSVDTSQLKMSGDDFKQEQAEAVMNPLIKAMCAETVAWGKDRQSWMTFASGVKSAVRANDEYKRYGVQSAEVYGDLGDERDRRIRDFKAGKLRSIVVYDIGTIGFNHKPIDLLSFQRASASVAWWVQAGGRGTRTSAPTGKTNCLGLDFGGNTLRLGPINDPFIPDPKKRGQRPGVAPVKICPQCGFFNHTVVRNCANCGYEFPLNAHLDVTASTMELIKTDKPTVEVFDVSYVLYDTGKFLNTNRFFKVTYHTSKGNAFDARVWLEDQGERKGLAVQWWKRFYCGDGTPLVVGGRPQAFPTYVPDSVNEAVALSSRLRVPRRIRVRFDKKQPLVIGYDL